MSVKLEWRESQTFKGNTIYGKDSLLCEPGKFYEFTEAEAKQALTDFPNNWFLAPKEKKEVVKKVVKETADKAIKDDETKAPTKTPTKTVPRKMRK